jgi:hypothetical protein
MVLVIEAGRTLQACLEVDVVGCMVLSLRWFWWRRWAALFARYMIGGGRLLVVRSEESVWGRWG